MPKAQKTESGMWRCRAFYQDADGRHQKSFTAPTKKEAEFLALQFLNTSEKRGRNVDMTLHEAYTAYMEARKNVLSPSTYNYYKKMRDTYLKRLMPMKISNITQEDIQTAINDESLTHAPKTVRNINGSLSAVLSAFRPNFKYRIKLPQPNKNEIYIPTNEEIKKLIEYFDGTDMEIPILLAVFLGLRQSEIVGLKWKNVSEDGKIIKIDTAVVKGVDNKNYEKPPKTVSGNRTLTVPEELSEKLKAAQRTSEYVTQLTGTAIYKKFSRSLKELGIRHFRFHDIRHYNASVMLALNIPNKYAQARLGHATDNMLKNVYQHLMSEKEKDANDSVNKYFDDFFK